MNARVYALPSKTTVENAVEMLAAYASLESESVLEIDASAVDSIDGATVMTLANIAKTAAAAEAPVAVKSPSQAFTDSFNDLGLFEDLMRMEFRK